MKNTLSMACKRDLKTKSREAILAMRLEHELTKNQILEDYLNLVYFGNSVYGIAGRGRALLRRSRSSKLDLAAGGAARRVDPVAGGAQPDQAPGRGRAPSQ